MKLFYKGILLFSLILTLSACGGSKEAGDAKEYFEETQEWTKFDNSFIELSSYDTNEIDGKPFAMLIHLANWTDDQMGQMLFILYNIDGSMENKDDHYIKVKEGLTTVKVKLDILDQAYDVDVAGMGNSFTMVLQNTPEDREFFNVFAHGLLGSKKTTITAPLENGEEYSWNFNTYLNLQ